MICLPLFNSLRPQKGKGGINPALFWGVTLHIDISGVPVSNVKFKKCLFTF